MARITDEQRRSFEEAVIRFLDSNPNATTASVGEALYDQWRNPGPEGSRPWQERATDWAKRKLTQLSKSGKVYQPSRGTWVTHNTTTPNNPRGFNPISIFNVEREFGSRSFSDDPCMSAVSNSPFVNGLLRTAERHGSVDLSEPMLHALIQELTLLLGDFEN